jgi:hypothetical protein
MGGLIYIYIYIYIYMFRYMSVAITNSQYRNKQFSMNIIINVSRHISINPSFQAKFWARLVSCFLGDMCKLVKSGCTRRRNVICPQFSVQEDYGQMHFLSCGAAAQSGTWPPHY